jgi:hypothetical protein
MHVEDRVNTAIEQRSRNRSIRFKSCLLGFLVGVFWQKLVGEKVQLHSLTSRAWDCRELRLHPDANTIRDMGPIPDGTFKIQIAAKEASAQTYVRCTASVFAAFRVQLAFQEVEFPAVCVPRSPRMNHVSRFGKSVLGSGRV